MKNLKLGLSLASVAVLCACSNGGSGTSNVRLNGSEEIAVAENSSSEFTAPHAIGSVSPILKSDAITISFDGNMLSVTASELTNPTLAEYDVYMVSGERVYVKRYEIVGVNTSAQTYEAMAYDVQENRDRLLNLTEDREVYNYFVDLAFLKEDISPKVRDDRYDDFDATQSPFYDSAYQSTADLLTAYSQYVMGSIDEAGLANSATTAASVLNAHSEYGLSRLREVEDLSLSYIGSLPSSGITFSENVLRFSRFFDASMIDSVDQEGNVTYSPNFQMLAPLTGASR